MGRKGRFEGGLWEGKYCLKEEYGKEKKAYRKSMGKKGRLIGRVWERKEGLKEKCGKENKV